MSNNPQDGADNESPVSYRQIFDESPAPKYIFDLQTLVFLAVNNAAIVQYGYTREEFLALKVTDIRSAEDEARAPLKEILSNQSSETFSDYGVWKHRRKNGDYFYVHIFGHTTTYNGREARYAMAIDVDAKIKTQLELEEKNAEISDILESVTDGFFAVNADWEVTFMNNAAEDLLQCRREDLIGRNLWDCFSESVGSRSYIEYHKVLREKRSTFFEDYYPPLDIWVAIRAYPSKDGLVIYFIDITEQKRIRQKIEQDEQNLRSIINNTTDLIWSINRNYEIISANEPFYNRMELVTGKRINKISHDDFPADSQRKWIELYERGFRGETLKTIWHEQLQGRDQYEEISINPIVDGNSEVLGLSCISRDITDIYVYTKQIEQQNEQLKKIAWIQSHEVRAPLSDILGLVSLIREGLLPEQDRAKLLGYICEAANQLDTVVARIVQETYREGDGFSAAE